MHNARKRLLAGPYLVWIIGFTVLPILMILYYAFTNSDGGFTWANIAAIADPVHIKALLLSLKLGILCTVVCLLLSYPLAMILNSLHIKHQSFVVFIFVLPMWMNFMLRILAWQMLLSNNGIINGFLSIFGIPKLHMLNTQGAVVFGMIYDYADLQFHSTYPQGNNRCGKGFRCQQFYHLLPYHSAAYCAWHCQRNYYGIRTGTYLLCYFRPFRRR